jgi:hypothetical protein
MLQHVTTRPKGGGIQPTGALCAAGQKTDFDPSHCCAGDNECWERLVEPETREDLIALPPLALHDAIGYLDAVWRNAFKKKGLLSRGALLSGGIMATACKTSQDFKDKVSAVVDAFNAFQVPIDTRDGSLHKMVLYLKNWARDRGIPDEEFVPVEQAIAILKKVTRLRAGFEHSAAREDFEAAQQALGISLPAESYAEEWNRLVARVTANFTVVRQFIRAQVQEEEKAAPAASPPRP